MQDPAAVLEDEGDLGYGLGAEGEGAGCAVGWEDGGFAEGEDKETCWGEVVCVNWDGGVHNYGVLCTVRHCTA